MITQEKIVWGMIGCGDVTEVKNGPGLYLASSSELKGIWNRTREKAENWTKRHGHGKVYDSIDELLSDPEIDIIYIATTPDVHAPLAIRCAQAGKHVLVEKPVAPTYEEGLAMKEAFEKAGKKCFVCFYRRTMNRFLRLQEILESGEIGRILAVQILRSVRPLTDPSAWRADPAICGGDIFTETDIHALDIMEMIMGPVADFAYSKNADDATYSLTVRFKNNTVGSGLWNYRSAETTDQFVILGTEGRIEFNFFNNSLPLKIWGKEGCREEVVEDGRHVGLAMEQAIVDELLGRGSFSGTLDAALETLKITSRMYFGK